MAWWKRAAQCAAFVCVLAGLAGCQTAPAPVALTATSLPQRIALLEAAEAEKITVSKRSSMLAAGIYIMGDFTDYRGPVAAAAEAEHFVFGAALADAIFAAVSDRKVDIVRVKDVSPSNDTLVKAQAAAAAGAQAYLEVKVVTQGIRAQCLLFVDCGVTAGIDVKLIDATSGQVLFQKGYRYGRGGASILDRNAEVLPYDEDRYGLPSEGDILDSPGKVVDAWRAAVPLVAERVATALQPIARPN